LHLRPLLLAAAAAAITGCASSPKPNFSAVYPGMHSQQVVAAMQGGPTRSQEFSDGSAAWYYGEDQCVLIRDEKVISKQETQENTSVDAVVVSLKNSTKATCAPAGMAEAKSEQEIDTPVGTFKGSINPGAIKDKMIKTKNELVGDSVK
jgi:outer membrane protein assembly factor BamE (lipoprotein component of BamABCDE complex)